MDFLVEHHIHLEICPTSNVRLGRVMTYSEHPIREFWKRGIHLGLNTDDPGLFASDLSEEYCKVMKHCGFSLADIKQTINQSIQAAFLPAKRKEILQQRIDQDWRQYL